MGVIFILPFIQYMLITEVLTIDSEFCSPVQTESEIEVKGLIDALGLQEKQQFVRIFCLENRMSETMFSNYIKQFSFIYLPLLTAF